MTASEQRAIMGFMRVIVLGAGVIGLTTAVSLLEAGCDVQVVADASCEATTSYVAAGVWFPTHVGPPDKVAAWGRRTLEVLAGQARDSVPGVVMRESLALYRSPPGRPDWTASVGPVREAAAVELPPGYAYGLRFAVPQADMPTYLPWLMRRVRELGGEIVTRHVTALGELSGTGADALVNCPGLAARELVGDKSVYPVRGQVVRVANPGITMSVRDEFHPAGRAYVHPRASDCILGGTLDEHQWDVEPDPATAAAVIARCTEIVPALAGARVIGHLAGLRPGRPEVRLEEEGAAGGGASGDSAAGGGAAGDSAAGDSAAEAGGPRVVHNYGHGGAGVTLSWGCAEQVTGILLNGDSRLTPRRTRSGTAARGLLLA